MNQCRGHFLLLLIFVLLASACSDATEEAQTTRAFPDSGPAQDWHAALRAFALESSDTLLLKTWYDKRALPQDSLSDWLKKNYWALQSLGIRLAEQAVLLLGFEHATHAQAKLDTVQRIAEDFAKICNDRLLLSFSEYLSRINVDSKRKRANLTLQWLSARDLLRADKPLEALRAFQDLSEAARGLGDPILEMHAELRVLGAWALQDHYTQAVAHGQKLLTLTQQRGYKWAEAQTLNIVADAYRVLDRDSLALQCTRRAFEIAQGLADRLTLRDSYFYRARILYRMDSLQAAERALQEMNRLDFEAEYRADALLLQGQIHQEQGEYGLAQTDMEEAAHLFEQYGQSANVAAVHSSLSLLHLETGDYERALSDERKAYALYLREQSENRRARSRRNLGFIFAKSDSLSQAEVALREARVLFRASGEARGEIETMLLQGELLMKQSRELDAEQAFRSAAQDALRRGFILGHASACLNLTKITVQQNRIAETDSLLLVAERIARTINSPSLKAEVQWLRARLALKQTQPQLALAHFEQAMALQEKVFGTISRDSLRVSFFATVQDLFDEAIALALELGENERALMFAERGRARALLEAWGDEFADSSRALLGRTPAVRAMQKILPPSARVIVYRALPHALVAWLISPEEFITKQWSIDRTALEDSTRKYLLSLGASNFADFRRRADANPAAVYHENRAWGRWFYEKLLQPVAQHLVAGSEIYVIPDGILHQLPIGALVTSQDRFMEEEYLLAKTPSLAVLHQGLFKTVQVPQLAANRLLFVGNPAGDLPAAQDEMANVAAQFARKKLLSQSTARFDTIKASLREGTEVFHLSLHAVADQQRALNSYVELSRAEATNLRPSTERIYARRLLEWDMSNTWLVVLNGCETASGKVVRGEGVLNMARLFAVQRVSVVVASLWKNDDRWSVALVTAFYRNLAAGVSPQVALHRAKLETLKQLSAKNSGQYPLPYFWSVFELYLNRAVTQTNVPQTRSFYGN